MRIPRLDSPPVQAELLLKEHGSLVLFHKPTGSRWVAQSGLVRTIDELHERTSAPGHYGVSNLGEAPDEKARWAVEPDDDDERPVAALPVYRVAPEHEPLVALASAFAATLGEFSGIVLRQARGFSESQLAGAEATQMREEQSHNLLREAMQERAAAKRGDANEALSKHAIDAAVELATKLAPVWMARTAAKPKAAEPKAAEPKAAEPKAADVEVLEPKAAEPKAADVEVLEPKAGDVEVLDVEVLETKRQVRDILREHADALPVSLVKAFDAASSVGELGHLAGLLVGAVADRSVVLPASVVAALYDAFGAGYESLG